MEKSLQVDKITFVDGGRIFSIQKLMISLWSNKKEGLDTDRHAELAFLPAKLLGFHADKRKA